jgi:outer membrane immunogenic protein
MKLNFRLGLLTLAASMAVASPAIAGEARIELRGGLLQEGDSGRGLAGLAAGYDFDIGSKAFLGPEVSVDKLLRSGNEVLLGLTARAGVRLGENGKLFVAGGGTVRTIEDSPYHFGGGYEHKLGGKLYLKGEYRHFLADRFGVTGDAGIVGIGLKF